MKWFYMWRYQRHIHKSVKYNVGSINFPNASKYETLFKIHIEKARYYATKAGRME